MIKLLLIIAVIVAFSGCKENTKKTTPHLLCSSDDIVQISQMTLNVQDNSLIATTDILNDVNRTLLSLQKMTDDINRTTTQTTNMIEKFAALGSPFHFISNTSIPFTLAAVPNATTPPFLIKEPLLHNYILLSSTSRLFPEGASVKTLFSDSITLANAWLRAVNSKPEGKNLYVTILQVEENATVTNLTNGLLIQNSQLL